jgi:hypothetical protein
MSSWRGVVECSDGDGDGEGDDDDDDADVVPATARFDGDPTRRAERVRDYVAKFGVDNGSASSSVADSVGRRASTAVTATEPQPLRYFHVIQNKAEVYSIVTGALRPVRCVACRCSVDSHRPCCEADVYLLFVLPVLVVTL